MPTLTIHSGSENVTTTVSDMRRRLARMLSTLKGEQEVTFSFSATILDYQPEKDPYQVFANEMTPADIAVARQIAKSRVLGMGYSLGTPEKGATDAQPQEPEAVKTGLWDYAQSMADEPRVIMGELARPEND